VSAATDGVRERLRIADEALEAVNRVLLDPANEAVNGMLAVIERHGGIEEINRRAREARRLEDLLARLRETGPSYYDDVCWLRAQRDEGAFVSVEAYRDAVLDGASPAERGHAVTLEISALQFFPWLIEQAERAIDRRELMPGRFIRVRGMAEQASDHGDTLAVAAAMQIIGASYVETLDTRGTDGSNIHLGGPETITGYFGGVGQPNDHAIQWLDEFLRYHTEYGIRQVLNVNPGTVLLAYLLHKLGVDIEFKISVYMGNDNPFAALWTLLGAKLFARADGSTSLVGFNWSNSVNNATIVQSSQLRRALGLEDAVRFEHHITETYKSIVIQPYDRLAELVELAKVVPNISAKHEGGVPEIDKTREHPSDILDYFRPKAEIEAEGLMEAMLANYLDKHDAVNRTARALTENGLPFHAAGRLHGGAIASR
jgi:hypothetical protein